MLSFVTIIRITKRSFHRLIVKMLFRWKSTRISWNLQFIAFQNPKYKNKLNTWNNRLIDWLTSDLFDNNRTQSARVDTWTDHVRLLPNWYETTLRKIPSDTRVLKFPIQIFPTYFKELEHVSTNIRTQLRVSNTGRSRDMSLQSQTENICQEKRDARTEGNVR